MWPWEDHVGLALGGGGARGVAHGGVLKALEEHKVKIAYVAGTSAGALAAAMIAFGKDSQEVIEIFKKLSFAKISSFRFQKMGLSSNFGLYELLVHTLGQVSIEQAPIPLAIVCMDLITGQKKVFTSGPLALLVQASATFPGLYAPISYKGMLLVDGAMGENVPISAVKSLGAKFILGICLSSPLGEHKAIMHTFDVISRCFDVMVDKITEMSLWEAHYVMYLDLSFMSRFKSQHSEKATELAYNQTLIMLKKPMIYWIIRPWVQQLQASWKDLKNLLKSLWGLEKIFIGAIKDLKKHLLK